MIAKIYSPISNNKTLSEKIQYHFNKIEEGIGVYLHDSFYGGDIRLLYKEMVEVGALNDRVSNKYFEVSLSFAPGEIVSDSKMVDIGKAYMDKMGYVNTCFSIIKHTDKDHLHFHLLGTTIDYNGLHISDSHSRLRSQKISRELEKSFGLVSTEYSIFKSESLKAIKHREFYFANALNRGLKSFSCKAQLSNLLGEYVGDVTNKSFTNDFYEVLLGIDLYGRVGEILQKNNMFSRLYKDELIEKLDSIYRISESKEDFLLRIQLDGYYARAIRNKNGDLCYTYGVKDVNKYFNESTLPKKYSYSSLQVFSKSNKEPDRKSEAEFISRAAIVSLRKSTSIMNFIDNIHQLGVEVIQHSNTSGLYGLSFYLTGSNNRFKGSEITSDRAFSFVNLTKHFNGSDSKLLKYLDSKNEVDIKLMSSNEQKERIEAVIRSSFSVSSSLNDFLNHFSSNHISFWRNKKDQAADQSLYSFKISDNIHAVPIKGSDLDSELIGALNSRIIELRKRDSEQLIKRFAGFTGKMEIDEQREYIYYKALKHIDNVGADFSAFQKLMRSEGIKVRKVSNNKLVTGFQFILNRDEAVSQKGNKISEDLNSQLFANFAPESRRTEYYYDSTNEHQYEPEIYSQSVGSPHIDNEPLSKKRKKKKKGTDLSNEL